MDSLASAARRNISDFEPQGLANMARAFSHLLYAHSPLLDAIAAASLPRISEFDSQGLANTAWSLYSFGFLHTPLRDALSAQAIRRICGLETQSYALLADIGLPCKAEIEKYLHQAVLRFVEVLLRPGIYAGAVATSCAREAAEARVDNFGEVGTRMLFRALGVLEPPSDFLSRAEARFAAEMEPDAPQGPTRFRVFAYAECNLVQPHAMANALFFQNGSRSLGGCRPRWLQPTSLPINAFVDRELCAEFQLLEAACELLSSTTRTGDSAGRGKVVGTLNLLVSGACCISCVAAVRQVQLIWPRLTIAVGIAPRIGVRLAFGQRNE